MFEAFRIGISIALRDGVSSGLLGISGQFRNLHGNVSGVNTQLDALERRIKSARNWTIGGVAMIGAGMAGFAAMKSPIEHAIEMDRQVSKLKLFGMGDAVNAEAEKYARAADVVGASYVENMRRMVEAQGVFRESGLSGMDQLTGAKIAMPLLGKIAFVANSLDPETGGKMNASALAMLRYVEMRGGVKNADEFSRIANAGFKTVVTSGGNVDWEQMRQFSAKGGVAAKALSEEALNAYFEPIIGELKGSTAGSGLMTAFNRLNGIVKVPNQVAHELVDLKLWDEKKILWNSQGGIRRFLGNPLVHADEYVRNPIEWHNKYAETGFASKHLTEEQITRDTAMIYGRDGAKVFSLVHSQMETILRGVDAWKKAFGIDDAVGVVKNGAAGKVQELHRRWDNALTQFGEAALPGVIRGVEKLTEVIKIATGWMQRNPELARQGVTALGVALLGLTLAGGMSVVVGGVKGASAMFGLLGMSATLLTTGPASLAVVATGMTKLALAAKGFGLVAAGAAGYTAGKVIYNATDNSDFMRATGQAIGHTLAFFGNADAKEAVGQEKRYRDAQGAPIRPASITQTPAMKAAAAAITPLSIKYSLAAPIPGAPSIQNNVSVLSPPSAKFQPATVGSTTPTTQGASRYIAPAAPVQNVAREIVLKVNDRTLAKVIDDHFGRLSNGGAGGTTQFDVNQSMPPIMMPSVK